MPIFLWLIFGTSAFVFVIIGLSRTALEKRNGWQYFLFLSLTCGAASLLAALTQTYSYVQRSDWSAMLDVFPALFGISTVCALICIILNIVLLFVNRKHK